MQICCPGKDQDVPNRIDMFGTARQPQASRAEASKKGPWGLDRRILSGDIPM